MNIFASNRIKPQNIRFPDGLDKVEWRVATSYAEFCNLFRTNQVEHLVLDAVDVINMNGLRCAYATTEICIDKHIDLPKLIVIGPDASMKDNIQQHIKFSKKWIDINRGKSG